MEKRENITAINVLGRKRVVRNAMIFIAELSCLLAANSRQSLAISFESLASLMLIWLSAWAIRLKS
jgi:hypothetical protein